MYVIILHVYTHRDLSLYFHSLIQKTFVVCTDFDARELSEQVQNLAYNIMMVSHPCCDHIQSCLTWLLRVYALLLCGTDFLAAKNPKLPNVPVVCFIYFLKPLRGQSTALHPLPTSRNSASVICLSQCSLVKSLFFDDGGYIILY